MRSEGGVEAFAPLAGGLGALPPVFQRAGGWGSRHLPYRDYASGEDITKYEQLRMFLFMPETGYLLQRMTTCWSSYDRMRLGDLVLLLHFKPFSHIETGTSRLRLRLLKILPDFEV